MQGSSSGHRLQDFNEASLHDAVGVDRSIGAGITEVVYESLDLICGAQNGVESSNVAGAFHVSAATGADWGPFPPALGFPPD